MNKLLISLISLAVVSGVSAGGYFLLRNGSENVAQQGDNQVNGEGQGEEGQAKSQSTETQQQKVQSQQPAQQSLQSSP